MAANEILYESDDILVATDLRESEGVIIGYSNYAVGSASIAHFADGVAQSLGFSGIFVSAKTNHWWQVPDRVELCDAVRHAAARFRNRIAYGASMGGYGALSLGHAMGCTRIIAIAPQTVISRDDIAMNPDWVRDIRKRPILRDDIAGDLADLVPEIVFDPYSDDRPHVEYLKQMHDVKEIRFPFAGHKLLLTLKQCQILKTTMADILLGRMEGQRIRSEYRKNRRLSVRYINNLAGAYLDRGNITAARILADRIHEMNEETTHQSLVKKINRAAKSK